MVDVQPLPCARHPQWPLAKPYEQSRSSGSPASTPDLDDAERIRIVPSSTHRNPALRSPDALLQERYLSSEEDLSPTDRDSTESFELDQDDVEIMEAQAVSPRHSATSTPSPCKVATAVSYVSAGRAKVVHLSESAAVREQTICLPSVANAVPILKPPIPRTSRMSMMAGHTPPASADRPNFPLRQDVRDVKAERRRTAMPMSHRPPLPKSPLVQTGDVLRPIPSTGSLRTTKSARHFSMAMAPSFGQFDRPRLMSSTTDVTNTMPPVDSNPGLTVKTTEHQRRMQRASVMDLRSRATPSPSLGRRSTDGEVGFARGGEVDHRATMTPTPSSTFSRTSTREQEQVSPPLERPPTISSFFRRPSSARSSYSQPPRSKRGSVLHIRQRSGSVHLPSFAPSTTSLASTKSVKTPTFLDTDPFEKKDVSPKSTEGKGTHRRLRSIGRTLTLAKMAVTPASKRDRSNGKSKTQPAPGQDSAIPSPISPMMEPAEIKHSLYSPSPLGPSMPSTPVTPSAYSVSSPASSVYGRRSSSRMSGPSPPQSASEVAAQRRKSSFVGKPKLVPRGADEREPPVELPPFPDELEPTGIQRKLRKRKSTLGFY